jgi:hypothetical protein
MGTLIVYTSSCSGWKNDIPDSDASDLRLELNLNNDAFSKDGVGSGTDIFLATVVLINETTHELLVNKRLAPNSYLRVSRDEPLGDIAFLITDPNGEELNFTGRAGIGFPGRFDFAKLGSRKRIAFSYDIFPLYFKTPIVLGQYAIQAVYHNETGIDNNAQVWKGIIYSNIVNFTIEQ